MQAPAPPRGRGWTAAAVFVALLALMQFSGQRAAAARQTVELAQRHEQHQETLEAMRDQTAALRELAGEVRETGARCARAACCAAAAQARSHLRAPERQRARPRPRPSDA